MLVLHPKQVRKAHQEPKTTSQAWKPPSGGVEPELEVRGMVSGAPFGSMAWGFISMSFFCVLRVAIFSVLGGYGRSWEHVKLWKSSTDRPSPASMNDGDLAFAVARSFWIGSLSSKPFDCDSKLCNFCLAECKYGQSDRTTVL